MNNKHRLEGLQNRLRNAVLKTGKSTKQIRAEMCIPKNTYYGHMNGADPGAFWLARYSKALDVSADWLLGLTNETKP